MVIYDYFTEVVEDLDILGFLLLSDGGAYFVIEVYPAPILLSAIHFRDQVARLDLYLSR